MLPRLLLPKLRELFAYFPIVVVSGARQVGKTTLLHEVFLPEADYVVFDPVLPVAGAREDPDLFLANRGSPLILDEIQYAPEVVAALKRKVDRDRGPGRYLLTGSQQWSVMKSLAESLAGRAVFLDLESLSLGELAGCGAERPWLQDFLENGEAALSTARRRLPAGLPAFENLWRGGMPGLVGAPRSVVPAFHDAYQRTYVERDVRLMADIADRDAFARFVRLASALSAQEVNRSQLGRDIGVTPQTAERWLGILRGTYQWHEVPAYSGNATKRISGKPKGYFADTGQICRLQSIASPETLGGHPLLGAIFETAAVADLRKQAAVLATPPVFHHWRAHSGAEVDLLLEYDGVFHAFEFKAKSTPARRDAAGIAAFRETYPRLRHGPALVVAPCEAPYALAEGVWAWPWDAA